MWLLYPLFLLSLASAANVLDAASLYSEARQQLESFPDKYHDHLPVYTHENLHQGIHVPGYHVATHEYAETPILTSYPPVKPVIQKLHQAMDMGLPDAAIMLADMHVFGNFSVQTNYTFAAECYRRVVAVQANAHAYYMLGHIYGTGMFGEVQIDKQRAKVYYEYAARNGNVHAAMVLAYQRLAGVDSPPDCEAAQFSYAHLARQFILQQQDLGADNGSGGSGDDSVSYNVNIADFRGGLYGARVSETASSVRTSMDNFVQWRSTLREENLESPDSQILEAYFDALQHYHGGFFSKKNHTAAFHEALTCVALGNTERHAGRLQNPKSIDFQIWEKCQGLVGRMYLTGHGVLRDVGRAHFWLSAALEIERSPANLLDMALVRLLDPVTRGTLSPECLLLLQEAAKAGSAHAVFMYARHLIAPVSPLETTYAALTYDLVRAAAAAGHHGATFYLADAAESGVSGGMGEEFTCTSVLLLYKKFVERELALVLPHLQYAFTELTHGHYKNALLGYLMAAEQGFMHSQLSAAFLLYQKDPLVTWRKPQKLLSPVRVNAAVRYLDLASAQGHIDATVLLGDMYLTGLPDNALELDPVKAFAYYSTAALSSSPHACYKLGYMYEYGIGTHDNTPDFYMAKRYYDLSIKYYHEATAAAADAVYKGHVITTMPPNTYAISFALLRLRLKFLFSSAVTSSAMGSDPNPDAPSWLDTLKRLAKSAETAKFDETENSNTNVNPHTRENAHAEGTTYPPQDDYQLFDYIILIFTLAFFAYVGFQNLRRQLRPAVVPAENPADPVNQGRGRFNVNFFVAI